MESFNCPHCSKPIAFDAIPKIMAEDLLDAQQNFERAIGVVNEEDVESLAVSADRLADITIRVSEDGFSQFALCNEMILCVSRSLNVLLGVHRDRLLAELKEIK